MFDRIPVFPLDRPAVRHLDMSPVQMEGQNYVLVKDPLGLIEGAALLPPDPALLMFLEMADGETSTGEMAQRITMQTGQIVPQGLFDQLAKQLDEALMLQSERFREALAEKYDAYMNSPTRPYRVFQAPASERLAMMKELGNEFRRHGMSSLSPPQSIDLPADAVVAILSPHIDYMRGGEAYAWAYRALKEHGTGAKTFVILGTSHRPLAGLFAATRKNYDTPFGLLETDQTILDELQKEYDGDLFSDEYAHADEHTIELQAVYLRKIFEGQDIKIVPILVGSIEQHLAPGASPSQEKELGGFCKALRTVLDRHGDQIALIGGVDFSHCGPEFGAEEAVDKEEEKRIEAGDREALNAIESGNPEQFFDHFRPDMNERNVCSIAPIYVVMETLKGKAKAKTLAYQQATAPDGSGLVSFASVAFIKEGVELKPKSRIILATR